VSGEDASALLAVRVAKDREVLLRLLSVTASLAGLCVAALGFLEAADRPALERSYADELIAVDAFLFVGCVYLIMWALRTRIAKRALVLSRIIDVVFLVALTTLIADSAYIVFNLI
jgi:hypothetical protein